MDVLDREITFTVASGWLLMPGRIPALPIPDKAYTKQQWAARRRVAQPVDSEGEPMLDACASASADAVLARAAAKAGDSSDPRDEFDRLWDEIGEVHYYNDITKEWREEAPLMPVWCALEDGWSCREDDNERIMPTQLALNLGALLLTACLRRCLVIELSVVVRCTLPS